MTATEFNDDLPGANNQDRVTYVVTGVDRRGRRFRQVHSFYFVADNINLYRGSVWEQGADGKRRLLKRVYN